MLIEYKCESEISSNIVAKYRDKLPPELIAIWEKYGFCSTMDGFIKFINPEDYISVAKEAYLNWESCIPIFSTGLCDLCVWEGGYIYYLNFRTLKIDVLLKGFHFFERCLNDPEWFAEKFNPSLFYDAQKKYGDVTFDEGFGFVPILSMGGTEDVGHMDKVKIREHIFLISQMAGPIGYT